MKKLTLLMAVVLLTSSVTGCGCMRRVRSLFNRGAYCGPAAVTTTPVMAQPPIIMPAPAPVVVPQASACDPCCVPCEPCCEPCCDPCCDPCCGGYPAEYSPTSYPMGGYYDSGCDSCGGMSGTIGTVPSGMIDPGPIPMGSTPPGP